MQVVGRFFFSKMFVFYNRKYNVQNWLIAGIRYMGVFCLSIQCAAGLQMYFTKLFINDLTCLENKQLKTHLIFRPPDKSVLLKTIFSYFSTKHMLWVLKRTVPKHMFKLMNKEMIAIFALNSPYG